MLCVYFKYCNAELPFLSEFHRFGFGGNTGLCLLPTWHILPPCPWLGGSCAERHQSRRPGALSEEFASEETWCAAGSDCPGLTISFSSVAGITLNSHSFAFVNFCGQDMAFSVFVHAL